MVIGGCCNLVKGKFGNTVYWNCQEKCLNLRDHYIESSPIKSVPIILWYWRAQSDQSFLERVKCLARRKRCRNVKAAAVREIRSWISWLIS